MEGRHARGCPFHPGLLICAHRSVTNTCVACRCEPERCALPAAQAKWEWPLSPHGCYRATALALWRLRFEVARLFNGCERHGGAGSSGSSPKRCSVQRQVCTESRLSALPGSGCHLACQVAACRSAPTPAPLRRPASSHGQGGVSHPRLLLQQLPEAQLCRGVPRHSGRLPPAPAHKVGSRYHIQRRICGCMEFVVCILHRLGLEGLLSLRKHAARLSRMGCTRNTPHTLPHPRPRLYPTQHSPAAACRWGPTPPAASWC